MSRPFLAWAAMLLGGVLLTPAAGTDQSAEESFRVYTDHPRLFLRAARLRLLRRERERNSMRWERFHLLIESGTPLPEPGFANALYYQVTGEKAAAKRAIDWANAPTADLRQVAIVFDWCNDQLDDASRQKLMAALHAGLSKPRQRISDLRSAVLAAIAVAGDGEMTTEQVLKDAVEQDWRGGIVQALREGKPAIHGDDSYSLLEMFHAIRDNLQIDLRESFPEFFHLWPIEDLLSYYPAPYPASENEYHIPFAPTAGEPDLNLAALSRAGELAMVAFDTNSPESQVLQGWLMDDRFLMRGPFGNPYEFLWANPYQPGLSYYHVPLVFHDEILGRLLARSSWDDDARWAGFIDGRLQAFQDGRATEIDPRSMHNPLDVEEAMIYDSPPGRRLSAGAKEANDVFVVGLEPHTRFHVETDDEEMRELSSDPGGILYFPGLRSGVALRFTPESEVPGLPGATNRSAASPARAQPEFRGSSAR